MTDVNGDGLGLGLMVILTPSWPALLKPELPPWIRSASNRSTMRSNTGSLIDRFLIVRRTRGRNNRKSDPSELASDVSAINASFRSSLTGPSRTLTSGCTTAEA